MRRLRAAATVAVVCAAVAGVGAVRLESQQDSLEEEEASSILLEESAWSQADLEESNSSLVKGLLDHLNETFDGDVPEGTSTAGNGGSSSTPTIPPSQPSAEAILAYTLGALAGVLGLILIFGGVGIPRVSTSIVFLYGFGVIGFSLAWFLFHAFQFSGDPQWWVPYAVSYGAAALIAVPFAIVGSLLPVGSVFTASFLGGITYMVVGIMINTAGVYTLYPEPWLTFLCCSASMLVIGLTAHGFIAAFRETDRRDMATFCYCLLGVYLVIKMCGIAANKYPCEYCNLHQSPYVGTWPYYVMFGLTFLLSPLFMLLQRKIYPAGADDVFQRGGVMTNQGTVNDDYSALPALASSRILLGANPNETDASEPAFGGNYKNTSALRSAASARGTQQDRFVAQF